MESVSLHDDIRLKAEPGTGVTARSNLTYLPGDSRNIAVKAAETFLRETEISNQRLVIDITKRIPVCAGMAGGSSDAAAVLRGLNQMFKTGLSEKELELMGVSIGSDVPYCVAGGTALAEGRGEILTPLPPMPDCHIVICKPKFPISTPELFARIDTVKIRNRPDTAGIIQALGKGSLRDIARRMYNVFEDVLRREEREVRKIKNLLLRYDAMGATMSGTGPTVFGVFENLGRAKRAYNVLKPLYDDCYLTKNIRKLEI